MWYSIREHQNTSQALSSRRHPRWSTLRRPASGRDRDSELGFVQEVITTCTQIEKLTPNTLVATTPGLILIRASNVLQELFQWISTIPCVRLHR